MVDGNPYADLAVLKFEPHLHTLHSDGQDTVAAMLAACKSAGYEAVAVTDHNTASGLKEAASVAVELGLILVPGVEVTTFRGHAVVLGVCSVPEWRNLEQRGMDALAADVHAADGVLSVAHPAALGSPVCSGCAWEWPIEPDSVDLWEVLNGARLSSAVPLELWRQLLARGARVGPVGAGDVHSTSAAASARPATLVYSRDRSSGGVLDALRARRLIASMGPRLDLWLEHPDGRVALAGECVSSSGWAARTEPAAHIARIACADGRECVYAELRDPAGQLAAVTAPIWIATSSVESTV
jgi:PHP domain-containing protein